MQIKKLKIIDPEKNSALKTRIKSLKLKEKLEIEITTNIEEFINDFNNDVYSLLILSDKAIENLNDTLYQSIKKISKKNPKTQILLIVEKDNIALAIRALKAGAYQYVKQPVNDEELKLIIETALDQQPQILEDHSGNLKSKNKFGEIIGNSSQMLQVYNQIKQAAHTEIPVIILGETGTGKDLVAYTIHRMSERVNEPYLAINLGALPSELVASELFGHEKGAFTGAINQHKGVFEQGNNGTVFLDEIDTMDDKIQISLLRLLEQKKFKRLGGTRSINSKARLIAATNEDIDSLVANGIFRSDLFYRLDVFRIVLPALRDRKSDIPLLADEMILKYAKTYKRNIVSVSQDSMDALLNFDWPGNVRELKNVIQRAVLVCNEDELKVKHLPPRFHNQTKETPSVSFKIGTPLDEVEREMVSNALSATNNNRKEAAKLLGISRRAIYNKLKKHNL